MRRPARRNELMGTREAIVKGQRRAVAANWDVTVSNARMLGV